MKATRELPPKVFPSIILTIETEVEARTLWHLLNTSARSLKEYLEGSPRYASDIDVAMLSGTGASLFVDLAQVYRPECALDGGTERLY